MKYRTTLAFAAWLVASSAVLAQEPSPPFLTVSGNGTVAVDPDQAHVRIGVESEAGAAREAQLETNRIANAILEAVRELGVPSGSVQTSRLGLSPVYESPSPGRTQQPRVIGYRATNTVSVELHDLDLIGPVVDAAITAEANRIEGVTFGLEDDGEARRLALVAAVDDAREKAEVISGALGVALGPVLEVTDHGVNVPPIAFAEAGRAMSLDVSTPIATGQIAVSASVTIRYRLGSAEDSARLPL